MITLHVKSDGDVWFGVACNKEKVFATNFGFSKIETLRSLLEYVPFNIPFQYSEENFSFAEYVLDIVKDVYRGKDVAVDVSLSLEHLSKYARRIIKTVSFIPIGYVSSYGNVAKTSGGSPRAVGHVMAHNPFAPIVPCHRVVCSDFTLGGYSGGLNVKLDLLKREKRGYSDSREIQVNGKRLEIFPVEFVLRKSAK